MNVPMSDKTGASAYEENANYSESMPSEESMPNEKWHSKDQSTELQSEVALAAAAMAPVTPMEPQAGNNAVMSSSSSSSRLTGWRWMGTVLSLLLGLLISVMESSIVATALVTIADDFGDFLRVQWVVLAYLLTYMGFAVITTRLSDVMGRKWTLVICLIIFALFSLACGLAKTIIQLIVFRAFQGIGGAGLFALCMVAAPEITPMKHFAAMSGAIGATFATSSVLGPLLGGAITKTNWRWIFLLNVPAGFFILVVVLVSWPGAGKPESAKVVTFAQVDYFGATLLLAGSVLLIFAIQEGGATTFAWNSPTIIATLVVGCLCLTTLAGWTWFLASRGRENSLVPILPPVLFRNRVMLVVLVSTFLTGYCFLTVLIELPERFQIVNGESPVGAGIHLLPLLVASALGSFLGGAISSKKNLTFYTLTAASCLLLIGCGLLSTVPESRTVEHAQYGYQVIFGVGVGLTFSTVTVMTIYWTNPSEVAAAQGAVSQSRIFGGSVGLGVATIILNNRISRDLQDILTEEQLSHLRQSLSTLNQLDLAQKASVVGVFARSFNNQLRICTFVAAAGVVVALFAYSKNPPHPSTKARHEEVKTNEDESIDVHEV